jgi:quercetin dioxygenase-like cupin family protein
MATNFFFSPDLLAEARMPEKGILSQTLYTDEQVKVVLFHFAEGNELSAHTAPMPATLHFLQGRGRLTLGTETMTVGAGSFAHMTPNLPHAIVAEEPLIMILVMVKGLREA